MRIYANCYELISEMYRDLHEMGIITHPKSYQNKNISENSEFWTKEYNHYVYRLLTLEKSEFLFLFDSRSKAWADSEFQERISTGVVNPGEAWKIRKDVWEEFLNSSGRFDYTYNQRINPGINLPLIIEEFIKNPDTRQLYLPVFDSKDLRYLGGTRRVPCSLGYFLKKENDKLVLTYIQRSADAVTHLGNDIYLAWKLLEFFAEKVGLPPGGLVHHIFSLHVYKKDWKILENGISELQKA